MTVGPEAMKKKPMPKQSIYTSITLGLDEEGREPGMAPKDGSGGKEQRDREIRDKMLFRLKEFTDDGFDTSALEETINTMPDLRTVKRHFMEFKEKVNNLKEIELDLLLMETEGHEAEVEALRKRLRDIDDIDEVKEAFKALKKKVEAAGKKASRGMEPERIAFLKTVEGWEANGYKVATFKDYVKTEKDLKKVGILTDSIEKKIKVLDKVRALLDGLDTDGFEADVRRIEKMVLNMDKVNLIWREVYQLREKITGRKKAVVQAEVGSKPVRIKKKALPPAKAKGAAKEEKEGKEEVKPFRRIDLYIQLVQTIILANRRLLTLDTLRLTQRALKKEHPKIMFFVIQKDFKIKSMMPDHPDSYRALENYLNRLYKNLSGLIGEEEAKDRMKAPAKEYIMGHIQEILASGLDDYFPVFLIFEEKELPDERPEVEEVEEGDVDWVDMVAKVQTWVEMGYKIDRLVEAMEGSKDLALALFRKTEEEIFWLKELEKDVEDLEAKGLKKECEEIRKKLKYPERISEIEDDILSLQMMLDMGDKLDDDGDLI